MYNNSKYPLTIKKLKDILKDCSNEDDEGNPTEVWIETGRNLSSPVTRINKLNYRKNDSGKVWFDIILESDAFKS